MKKLAACSIHPVFLTLIGLIFWQPPHLHASTPPPDTLRCLPFDFEQWERQNPRPAGKRLADLNVGEPRTVGMIYFLPNDRPYREAVVDSIKRTIALVQGFYSEQMQSHGHGNRTFQFETDEHGDAIVHRLDGQHPDSNYLDNTFDGVMSEVREVFDTGAANVYLFVIDNSSDLIDGRASGGGRYDGKGRGYALVPAGFSLKTVAHELGHAFGLHHDFRDDAFIMSYGDYLRKLSMCSGAYLSVHPYFNSDIGDEESENSTIELLSSLLYPPGSTSVAVRLEVNDPDGLHQVILSVETAKPHPAVGFPEVISCREMDGETNAVIEFQHNGVFPSNSFTSLSDPVEHPLQVWTIDLDGNVWSKKITLESDSKPKPVTLEGHENQVHSVAFSPDGKTLATGAYGENIRLWDVETGMEIGSLSESDDALAVVFSPGGTILASGSVDHTVKVWNLERRGEIGALAGHTGPVVSVAFSPDGTLLASGSYDHTIKLWEVETGRETATLEGHAEPVTAVALSPNGAMLASGSYDHTIKLWEIETGREITTLEGHTSWVLSLAFSPDGSTLASGANLDGTVRLWDVTTGQRINTITSNSGTIFSLAFSPDGFVLALGSGDLGVIEPLLFMEF